MTDRFFKKERDILAIEIESVLMNTFQGADVFDCVATHGVCHCMCKGLMLAQSSSAESHTAQSSSAQSGADSNRPWEVWGDFQKKKQIEFVATPPVCELWTSISIINSSYHLRLYGTVTPNRQAGSPILFCSKASFPLRGCRVPSKALFTAKHLTVFGLFRIALSKR